MRAQAEANATQPIVIRRIVRREGSHGGSWKVAFADFAVAMMAFFLLLWLMGQTSEAEKSAIAEYFDNPSAVPGQAAVAPAAETGDGEYGSVHEAATSAEDARAVMANTVEETPDDHAVGLAVLRAELEQAMGERGLLAEYADHLLIDETPGGLQVQVVDRAARSMFPLGSDTPTDLARLILEELAAGLALTDHVLSIAGHTDALPVSRSNYSNWELSTDRANAARRTLVAAGLDETRIVRVVGLAATAPLDADDPADAVNRRISILIMTRDTLARMHSHAGQLVSVQ